MRADFLKAFLFLTILQLIGCQTAEPEVQSMMHQVLGALQIPNKAERDSALATACCECADAGDIESVLLGLPKISEKKQQDEVAEECFRSFMVSGRQDAARRTLELVSDPGIRSNLFALLNDETGSSASQ